MNPVAALDKSFADAGFTLVRLKNHRIWRCPCGHTQITSSGSHNEGRGDNNARAQIARTLRACKQYRKRKRA